MTRYIQISESQVAVAMFQSSKRGDVRAELSELLRTQTAAFLGTILPICNQHQHLPIYRQNLAILAEIINICRGHAQIASIQSHLWLQTRARPPRNHLHGWPTAALCWFIQFLQFRGRLQEKSCVLHISARHGQQSAVLWRTEGGPQTCATTSPVCGHL